MRRDAEAAVQWGAISLLGALGVTRVIDLDTPWHLRVGELILATGSLPARDPLSYTSDQPWLIHEWLSTVLLQLAYRGGGWIAIGAVQALAIAATLAAVWWSSRSDDAPQAASWPRALAELAPLGALSVVLREALAPRATLFAAPLFALMLAVCARLARGQRAPWWALPASGLLLTQLHGGNPDGVALVALLALSTRRPRWAALALVMALLTCAGPYGWHVHAHFFALRASTANIREWQPFHRLLAVGSHAYLLAPALVVAAALALRARRRLAPVAASERWFAWLALAVWAVLAVRYQRFAVQASIVATVCVMPWWRAWVRDPAASRGLAAALGVLLVSIAALSTSDRWPGVGPQRGRFPEDAVAWLRAHTPPGPMFNSYNFGGYLLWAWPSERVFIDGRGPTVYAPEHLAALEAVYRDPPHFEALERRWGFRLAVVQRPGRGQGLYVWLRANPRWSLVHQDPLAAVFVRRDPPATQ